jgi:hypothetical protein
MVIYKHIQQKLLIINHGTKEPQNKNENIEIMFNKKPKLLH